MRWAREAEDPAAQLARRIIYALHVSVIPYADKVHERAERVVARVYPHHRNLTYTYVVKDWRHPLSAVEMPAQDGLGLGITCTSYNVPGVWLNRSRADFSNQTRLHWLFSGSLGDYEQITLTNQGYSALNFGYFIKDINSAIVFFTDLNRFNVLLYLPIIPQPSRLLDRAIYLRHEVDVGDGVLQQIPVYQIPYIVFVTTGSRFHPIYLFFSRLFRRDERLRKGRGQGGATHLPHRIYQAFYDRVLGPTLRHLTTTATVMAA